MKYRWMLTRFKTLIIAARKQNIATSKALVPASLVFIIIVFSFSVHTVVRQHQQSKLQSESGEFIDKAITLISANWNYLETQSLLSFTLINQIKNENINIFKNFSHLGKLTMKTSPVRLESNPRPDDLDIEDYYPVIQSYKTIATYKNGQAIFLINLGYQDKSPVITFINIDAIYNSNIGFVDSDEVL